MTILTFKVSRIPLNKAAKATINHGRGKARAARFCSSAELMTITEYIEKTADCFAQAGLFFGHGTDNALDEAVYLVYGSLQLDFDQDYRDLSQNLSNAQLQMLDDRVGRRVEGREPVAYLVGEAWFCGLPFYCDERALIPRSPIAELINNGFQTLCSRQPARILDLCTGGGCIGIACAMHFGNSRVDLVDISEDSLQLAVKNIGRHGTSERVRTIQSDLFERVEGRFDLIIANPPYVSAQEVDDLPPEYRHEPRLGLESDDDGLDIPLRILQQAPDFLEEDGLLVMEVGYSAERLQARLTAVPLLWLSFEQGGQGVLAIRADELVKYRENLI